ncbi:MAG: ATP-binding protein [Pseudomonadota bacterium]
MINLIKSFFIKKSPAHQFVSLSRDYYIYAGFILAIVLASSLWSAFVSYNAQKTALQDQLITQSQLIDNTLGNYFNYVSHIAEDKGHKIALKGGDLNHIAYLFKRNFFFPITKSGLKRKAFLWPHFSWVDKNGNILFKSEIGILPKPEKIRDEKYFYQSTINSWQLQLSDPYYDAAQDQIFIDGYLGVSDLNNDKYLGSITTKFNIEKLAETLKASLKKDTKFIILSEELKIVIQSDNNNINHDDFFANKLTNIDDNADLILIKDQLKYDGNIYKTYKKSADYPLIILTGYNTNSFNQQFIITFGERFSALFGAAFFIALILFIQRQRIIKPVSNLAKITKKLSQGEDISSTISCIKQNKQKYSSEIYELYQGILLTSALIDKEQDHKKLLEENNLKLIELNQKLEQQNELAKKSSKSREKFLSQTRQNIIEDKIIKMIKDLNSILNHYDGNIILTNPTLIDLHKKMLSNCAQILSYVSDNLTFSYVNVKQIISEAIEMAHYDADLNNIKLSYEINDEIADIYVDERSIKHVIIALINYAMEDRKRNNPDSLIKITANVIHQSEQQFLQLIFEDNGHGISEEMRMSFEQNAEKEGKNNNNISLSLQAIRSILSSHQSTLEIDNTLGKGSVMTVQILYRQPNQETENDQENQTIKASNIVNLFPRQS